MLKKSRYYLIIFSIIVPLHARCTDVLQDPLNTQIPELQKMDIGRIYDHDPNLEKHIKILYDISKLALSDNASTELIENFIANMHKVIMCQSNQICQPALTAIYHNFLLITDTFFFDDSVDDKRNHQTLVQMVLNDRNTFCARQFMSNIIKSNEMHRKVHMELGTIKKALLKVDGQDQYYCIEGSHTLTQNLLAQIEEHYIKACLLYGLNPLYNKLNLKRKPTVMKRAKQGN